MKTGDILLFDEYPSSCWFRFFTSAIKWWTGCKYSHCALLLKDEFGLKGLHVWESSYHGTKDPQDGKIKFGVQITPWEDYTRKYPGVIKIYIRKRKTKAITKSVLKQIHEVAYDKPYDIHVWDWVCAMFNLPFRRVTDRFWCSAFVSYALVQSGDLPEETDWSMMRPKDLSSMDEHLKNYEDDKILSSVFTA